MLTQQKRRKKDERKNGQDALSACYGQPNGRSSSGIEVLDRSPTRKRYLNGTDGENGLICYASKNVSGFDLTHLQPVRYSYEGDVTSSNCYVWWEMDLIFCQDESQNVT